MCIHIRQTPYGRRSVGRPRSTQRRRQRVRPGTRRAQIHCSAGQGGAGDAAGGTAGGGRRAVSEIRTGEPARQLCVCVCACATAPAHPTALTTGLGHHRFSDLQTKGPGFSVKPLDPKTLNPCACPYVPRPSQVQRRAQSLHRPCERVPRPRVGRVRESGPGYAAVPGSCER
jgi:hypothetical protein